MSDAHIDGAVAPRARRTVLFLWPYVEWGGVQIYFTAAMKLLKGVAEVRAVMPEGSDSKIVGYMRKLDIPCEFFPGRMDLSPAASAWHKVRRRIRDARCAFSIARHVRRYDAKTTVVQVDLPPWYPVWFCLLLYLALRGNVFLTLHIALPPAGPASRAWRKALFALVCRLRGFHLLVSNRDMLASLAPCLPAGAGSSTPVAYTGVDVAEIDRAAASGPGRAEICRKFALPEDRILAFSLGQLIERKGCLVMLDAVKRVRSLGVPVHFVWIGQGPMKERLEAALEEPDLRGAMRILTPAQVGPERLDLLALLNAADLFVHPSFAEGLPGAVLEAMALGKACVATRVNAIPEAITDRETGLLVPPGDAKALADAVAEICRDASLRERLAAAGRKNVLSRFDESIGARTTVALYEACWAASG